MSDYVDPINCPGADGETAAETCSGSASGRVSKTVLVTGATGYVGARLVPRLVAAGFRVRAAGRSMAKLCSRPWSKDPNVELCELNVFDSQSLARALDGVWAAYYLVHSMNPESRDFAEADRTAALLMRNVAAAASLSRIIYLGGLGEDALDLSKHLRSRKEVAEILCSGPVPVTVLRAGMILGSGSTSFEILRYLVERLPVMITPRWVNTPSQPIAVRNVLEYLVRCLLVPATAGRVFDIGGPEVLTYAELMQVYAQEAGLGHRIILPVPVFTPGLSSYWIHFVTPVPAYIARPLAEGLRNPVVCSENDIRELIPQSLLPCREAIKLALERIETSRVESSWTDAGAMPPAEWANPGDPHWAGGTFYIDDRVIVVKDSPAAVWRRLERLGGKTGWYYGNWLWKLRGQIDRVLGGVGLSRGRRNENELLPGDALDFWRVISVEKECKLTLHAEMILPGEAFLEFQITACQEFTEVRQIARFLPHGLSGLLYWWAVTPLHEFVFNGMLRGIAAEHKNQIVKGPQRWQNMTKGISQPEKLSGIS